VDGLNRELNERVDLLLDAKGDRIGMQGIGNTVYKRVGG